MPSGKKSKEAGADAMVNDTMGGTVRAGSSFSIFLSVQKKPLNVVRGPRVNLRSECGDVWLELRMLQDTLCSP